MRRRLLIVLCAAVLAAGGCGGGGDDDTSSADAAPDGTDASVTTRADAEEPENDESDGGQPQGASDLRGWFQEVWLEGSFAPDELLDCATNYVEEHASSEEIEALIAVTDRDVVMADDTPHENALNAIFDAAVECEDIDLPND